MATPAKKPAKKAAKKTAKKSTRAKKVTGPVLAEDHTPSEAVAHEIMVQFGDLTPSVRRIMESELGEPGRLHAITLFRDSLGVPGDPNRHPAKAIEAGQAHDK